MHNVYESQSFFSEEHEFMDKLKAAFELLETKRQENKLRNYGMATWLCYRAKPEEEKIYLNL